jgi:hypothetical protein
MKDKMDRACSAHEERRNAYMILVRRPDGKILPERFRRK